MIGLLNGGVSGFSMGHSDIGGYTSVNNEYFHINRNKELLLRWIEMSAFSDIIMRSHPSNNPDFNFQIYSDNQTAQFLALFGNIHKLLASYKKQLMVEATTYGIPIVRSLMLEYPDDDIARKNKD
jgi:alpha-glucosidase